MNKMTGVIYLTYVYMKSSSQLNLCLISNKFKYLVLQSYNLLRFSNEVQNEIAFCFRPTKVKVAS